ncbi:MAG: glycosyltransferase family 4 protein [Deltaproteobacteria bacterium]|nr:glycosyltransferase family 4 protein [Deltaproteobacteria bacterium]
MRSLHVAALPFPTPQGTQALVGEYLRSLTRSGHDAQLLCYAHGARPEPRESGPSSPLPALHEFPIHRVRGGPVDRSERSGPSWRKVLADVALAREVGRLHRELRPDVVIAHHVEAAAACLVADVAPLAFVAHTRLDLELPVYLPERGPWSGRIGARIAGAFGANLDRAIVRLVGTIGTVSPDLARHVAHEVGGAREVIELVAPWPIPPPITDDERVAARAALGLDSGPVLSFVGNLDRYQGWDWILESLALLRGPGAGAILLVGTASAPDPVLAECARLGLSDRVRIVPLGGESIRRLIHAATDVVVVPRRIPGGLPVKLLDALARGSCVVAQRRALAGLETIREAVWIAEDDDPRALASSLSLASIDRDTRLRRGAMGRELVRSMHSDRAFLATFEALCAAAREGSRRV